MLVKHLQARRCEDPMRSPVVQNCLPFIKIAPDLRDTWKAEAVPSFDRTRLSESFRPWIMSLCDESLKEVDDEDGLDDEDRAKDTLTQAMLRHKKGVDMEQVMNSVNV